ncbi:MAG: ribosomal-protein-alanine acetyltransferase [Sphingomonadales bacterium CG12_big_fil_rev_8_21_14_0_65_65_10]|nr:MAG: ribosomal-protein-alanine acetyltransferase [Sphingomonadales bacterium CG12_big_fil_rev_8_21_14_0_65_65_10]
MRVMSRGFDPEYNEAWTRKQVTDMLAMPSGHLIAVDRDGRRLDRRGRVAGFALSRAAPGEEELLLIAVDPAHREAGLGARLLALLAADARARGGERLFLEMREGNPAVRLYDRIGFVPIGRRKEYYRTRSGHKLDAITFALTI